MERAARVLRNSEKSRAILNESKAIEAIWPLAVGKAIARHTAPVRLVRTTLVVATEDVIWQRQLRGLETQILARVCALLPDLKMDSVEFRIGTPKREPQKATAASSQAAPADEADRIADPVLRRIYQMSRKKASA